jgi:glycosyltransferase involved in cell wall biosynthesis
MAKRATVIIPTYGEAKFALWAIKSVQRQSVEDIEICIICDGSPEHMVSFFNDIADEDPRITVFRYTKSPRTGEPYRDEVISKTTGRIICYCAHDDIWLPDHIETIEKALSEYDFVHTLHAAVNIPENIKKPYDIYSVIYLVSIKSGRIRKKMQGKQNFFGLSYGAHTRKAYLRLEKGWETTPDKDIPTDLYMWNKFILGNSFKYKTIYKVTALCFPADERRKWQAREREDELRKYYYLTDDEKALKKLRNLFVNLINIKSRRFKNLSFKRIKRKLTTLFFQSC